MVCVPEQKHQRRAILDAIAGALAGAVARMVVGPLDVLKIRFQVQLEPIARAQGGQLSAASKYTGFKQALMTIAREEGIQVLCSFMPMVPDRKGQLCHSQLKDYSVKWHPADRHCACKQGLWRGTVPGLLLTVPYTSVQFVALQQCRSFAARHGLLAGQLPSCPAAVQGFHCEFPQSTLLEKACHGQYGADRCLSGVAGDNAIVLSFLSGATAGAAATMASYPFDLLRTLLAAQGKPPVRCTKRLLLGCPKAPSLPAQPCRIGAAFAPCSLSHWRHDRAQWSSRRCTGACWMQPGGWSASRASWGCTAA